MDDTVGGMCACVCRNAKKKPVLRKLCESSKSVSFSIVLQIEQAETSNLLQRSTFAEILKQCSRLFYYESRIKN